MGVKQIINDVDASDLGIGYSAVVNDGLQYINFYGGSVSADKNLVGNDGSIIGTPSSQGMGVGLSCTKDNKIKTGITRGAKGTVLAVFDPNSTIRSYAFSDASSARPLGFAVYAEPTATVGVFNLVAQLGFTNASGNSAISATIASSANVNVPNFVSATFDTSLTSSNAIAIKNMTKATSAVASATSVTAQSSGATLTVGSILDASIACSSNVLCIAYYNRVLTDVEIAKQYTQIKKYYKDVHNIDL